MAAIRGKDTKPEMLIRRGLHARGVRFRLQGKGLPGKPDIVLPKFQAVIFVHGCFWHRHTCPLFRWPKTRQDFWREKIDGNARRDLTAIGRLRETGWRVAVVWECALTGRGKRPLPEVIDSLTAWLSSDEDSFCVEGQWIDCPS